MIKMFAGLILSFGYVVAEHFGYVDNIWAPVFHRLISP